MEWNILIVDDDAAQAETTRDVIISNRMAQALGDGTKINAFLASGFDEALKLIEYSKFDLIILDLKDDETDGDDPDAELSGERVLAQLRKRQFTPVIFYTGYAQKVEDRKTSFVKVVRKGTPADLRNAVVEISATNLPQLIRYVQEEQRKYLWEHVENAPHANHGNAKPDELAFLLGRRLANALEGKTIRRFFDEAYAGEDQVAHPIEMYIWPPMGTTVGFGDILNKTNDGAGKYYIVLNPACDFSQCKAEKALLAQCHLLSEMPEYKKIAEHRLVSTEEPSKSVIGALRSLMADNRQGKGIQADRYKFLPGTSFLPNLVADYQYLEQVSVDELDQAHGYSRIATLDTPFAEAMQNRYVRYYGRIGTPDLEWDTLLSDAIAALPFKSD